MGEYVRGWLTSHPCGRQIPRSELQGDIQKAKEERKRPSHHVYQQKQKNVNPFLARNYSVLVPVVVVVVVVACCLLLVACYLSPLRGWIRYAFFHTLHIGARLENAAEKWHHTLQTVKVLKGKNRNTCGLVQLGRSRACAPNVSVALEPIPFMYRMYFVYLIHWSWDASRF